MVYFSCKHILVHEVFYSYEFQGHPTDRFGELSVRKGLKIPYDFLKGIFISNFRDMGNLRPISFRIDKNVVSGTEKRSAKIFRKEISPKVFGKWTKMRKDSSSPGMTEQIKIL